MDALKFTNGTEGQVNRMRLIDAEAFIESLGLDVENAREDNIGEIVTLEDFDRQPTVFDKEKVIEELREELNLSNAEKERCARENPLQFDSAKGYVNGIANAIEIVKKGGIE